MPAPSRTKSPPEREPAPKRRTRTPRSRIARRGSSEEPCYRALFESHPRPMWICDSDTHVFLAVNDAAVARYGYSREEFLTMAVDDICLPEEPTGRDTALTTLGFRPVSRRRHRMKDGSTVEADTLSHRVQFGGRDAAFVAIAFPADQRLTEAQLRESQERLHRITGVLHGVIDLVPAHIWVKDRCSRFVIANAATARALGATCADEVLGKTDAEFLDADQALAFRAEELHILETGEPVQRDAVYEDADGLYCLATLKVPLRDEDGHIAGILGLNQDISERKRAERALEKQTEALARSNADLEQFAYVASHDLQEPLRMVSSYTQLLARRYTGRLGSDADEYIGFVKDATVRMQALIRDLLAYSRATSEAEAHTAVDCSQIVEGALANLQYAIQESDALVTSDPLPLVFGDRCQLTQLFQNLIGNAIKFRGDRRPEIHIGVRRDGGHWLFTVQDNGIGIDPQFAERIFVIFQRLHDRSTYSGTGIGLAICKKIVERHGGRIWMESEPGRGARFYFTLTARRPQP